MSKQDFTSCWFRHEWLFLFLDSSADHFFLHEHIDCLVKIVRNAGDNDPKVTPSKSLFSPNLNIMTFKGNTENIYSNLFYNQHRSQFSSASDNGLQMTMYWWNDLLLALFLSSFWSFYSLKKNNLNVFKCMYCCFFFQNIIINIFREQSDEVKDLF